MTNTAINTAIVTKITEYSLRPKIGVLEEIEKADESSLEPEPEDFSETAIVMEYV